MPASRRIGISVPSAVVVSASPTRIGASITPQSHSSDRRRRAPSASESSPADDAEPQRHAADPLELDLDAGEEEEEGEPEGRERLDEVVGVGEAEHLRPDDDPEHDLGDDDRHPHAAREVGEKRRGRRHRHDHEDVLAIDLHAVASLFAP